MTPRVAIVDLDTVSGALHPGARLRKAGNRIDGEYEVREALLDPDDDPLFTYRAARGGIFWPAPRSMHPTRPG